MSRSAGRIQVRAAINYNAGVMALTVLLGAQWGDEGKGRITDALAAEADVVARFNGGPNAGHSINVGGRTIKLHQVPSGIFRDGCLNVIGNGVVLNPAGLLKEIEEINATGQCATPDNLKISDNAHIILHAHIALDRAREKTDGGLGTTQTGIGFAYADKAFRVGIRAGLMRDPERFGAAVQQRTREINRALEREHDAPPVDEETTAALYAGMATQLAPYLANTSAVLRAALKQNKRVLAEGAQGVLLDIDHGTYPYVTSSSATAGGVLTGLGVPPQSITRVMGVAKAFSTRVGKGPMPTELDGEMALRLRGTGENPWDEYGSTTGRPRRVGWLDAVALRTSVAINGIQELALTKLDVLTGIDTLRIATMYLRRGDVIDEMPTDAEALAECKPVYEDVPGWSQDVSRCRRAYDLPVAVQRYITRIEALVGARVGVVSVGPERDQMVTR